ncbi:MULTISPECIES: shikimate 5-dehydrogenase [Mammaliicoccus]|uniref:Shikimate dehydrogenase (NADP(+)) n=1 Tax=Mammaliicoccus lentus TaxID=42858 RepID=A0ABS6H0F4_MAMLE|nr:shikimate 5-dehydrogenase [Mammaliicoccus lentus]MBF0840835.1 quinate/shikimate dehydrogenase [Mammaliicoccus lentus]MBU6114066.1 quinate/shikimate dehydrogenase [Mammaliicoccus lentus]MBW0763129.1 quinate/shikimate dehydrogenase [Mammaliicoccus lentus]WQK50383.1 quinate/shikimate dehydrogenase [Mammaliicoccus lentus]WQL56169.1 quinate/shikimate dehydrogenase [Mammaliicoccus lentus]
MEFEKNLEKIDGRTKLVGLLATPIGHTLSPRLHNLGYSIKGLNYAYLAFEVGNDNLEEAVNGMRAVDAAGFNVSMPNKMEIIQYLDELDDSAKYSGAVNTVVNDNGKLIGHNTDGQGYVENLLNHGVEIEGKKITLVGSGGAATPIAIQLAQSGVSEISIFARNDQYFKQAEENARKINEDMKEFNVKANIFPLEDKEQFRKEIADSVVLANGTSLGMKPLDDLSIVDETLDVLRKDLVVTDVVYNPQKSKLLQQAEDAGCTAINGLGMMSWQGAIAFKLFTGVDMPREEIVKIMFGEDSK